MDVEESEQKETGNLSVISVLFRMVAHFVVVLFTGFMIYTAWPGSSLFSWHPTFMTLAFAFFMAEAVLMFSPQSSLLKSSSRKVKGTYHWILNTCAVVSALLGLTAIVYNKIRNEYPHFTSWHGLIGVITVGMICTQATAGIFLLYPNILKGIITLTLADMKKYHATFGLLSFVMGTGSLVLGMNSSWFTGVVTGTSWFACVACPVVLAVAVMEQVTTAYLPKRK